MDTPSRNKWQARGFAVVIFILGFTSGILTLNAYHWARARRPGGPSDRIEQMATRLQLNADQKTKVQQIFGDTRQQLQALRKESEPRVNDIRQQADKQLQQVLTPDQWKKFEQMRDEMRAKRGLQNRER
jgi:Spy/CpxP family protein refolding chaperone